MTQIKPEAERWLRQAQYDRQAALANLDLGYHAWACFLSQQSAEKALKAFLYDRGEGPVIGHSTLGLLGRCAEIDNAFDGLSDDCKRLDQFYIPTRYPSGLPGGVPHEFFDESHSAVAIAALTNIITVVVNMLDPLMQDRGDDLQGSTP